MIQYILSYKIVDLSIKSNKFAGDLSKKDLYGGKFKKNKKMEEMYISKSMTHNRSETVKEMRRMFDRICLVLVIIGGLNWGSIGLFQFDLVAWLFGGQGAILSRIVYTVIALAAVWCISILFRTDTDMIEQKNHE